MVGAFRLPSSSTTAPPVGPTATPWVRPADWLTMPTIGAQEVIGLLAIYEDTNYIAVQCAGATVGGYTVDWGDGTVTNYVSNTIASKTYDFSSIPAGTTTSKGYRQVIVRITPQSGQNLTSVGFNVQHPSLAKPYTTGWLDIEIKMPLGTPVFNGHTNIVRYHRIERVVITDMIANSLIGNMFNQMTNLRVAYLDPTRAWLNTNLTGTFTNCYSLEEAPMINTINTINFNAMFQNCYNLKVVPQYNMQNATSMAGMFSTCRSLESVPLFNIGSGPNINMSTMFEFCSDLKTVPLLNTSAANTTNSMFANCLSLQSIPLLDIGNSLNTGGMFSGCASLSSVPLLNTSKSTNFNSMFASCQSLVTIPLLNTAKSLTFNSMFSSCQGLQTIPLINTELSTDFINMFFGCNSMEELPLLNTGSASTISSMFNGCVQLQAIPALNTSKVLNFANCFSGCLALREVPALNMSAGTSFTTFLNNNVSIGRSAAFGARFAHSYTNMALSRPEIVNIFTNLGTASGSQAITVSLNPGRAALTAGEIAIATGKGWTVV